jgi:hypothetical protein
LVQVDQKIDGRVPVREIRMKAAQNLGGGLAVGDLVVSYGVVPSQLSNVIDLAPAQMVRTLPLFLRIEGGRIQECWSKNSTDRLALDQVCQRYGNSSGYDPLTHECRAQRTQWFEGTKSAASCPAPARLSEIATSADCDYNLGTYVNSFQSTLNLNRGGGQMVMERAPGIKSLNPATRSCSCSYATDIDSSIRDTFKCKIRCIVPDDTTVAVGP